MFGVEGKPFLLFNEIYPAVVYWDLSLWFIDCAIKLFTVKDHPQGTESTGIGPQAFWGPTFKNLCDYVQILHLATAIIDFKIENFRSRLRRSQTSRLFC